MQVKIYHQAGRTRCGLGKKWQANNFSLACVPFCYRLTALAIAEISLKGKTIFHRRHPKRKKAYGVMVYKVVRILLTILIQELPLEIETPEAKLHPEISCKLLCKNTALRVFNDSSFSFSLS